MIIAYLAFKSRYTLQNNCLYILTYTVLGLLLINIANTDRLIKH